MRHLPFGIDGDRHGLPLRVLAPHLGAECMSKSMGLSLRFLRTPTPGVLDVSNDCLAAGMDVDVLDRDLLLALAAMMVQTFEKHGKGAGELVGEAEIVSPLANCAAAFRTPPWCLSLTRAQRKSRRSAAFIVQRINT
jgi:hypothetical protein